MLKLSENHERERFELSEMIVPQYAILKYDIFFLSPMSYAYLSEKERLFDFLIDYLWCED